MRADEPDEVGARGDGPRAAAFRHDEPKAGAVLMLDTLAPMLDRLLADSTVSGEHAMHLVVMDPAADPATASFDDAILVERSYGDVAQWKADYVWYARAKTRLAWREQMSLRTLFARHPARLRDDDIRVEGAVRSGRWVVGASGAQPWYDHAIATVAIALLEAAVEHAQQSGGTR